MSSQKHNKIMKKVTSAVICTVCLTVLIFSWGYMTPNKELVGIVGGVIGFLSGLLHVWRAWHGKIQLKASSWGIWALIGISVCVTYDKAGDPAAFWPTVGNAFFPILNFLYCALHWKETQGEPDPWDKRAFRFGVLSIALYVATRTGLIELFIAYTNIPMQFDKYVMANYIAIAADVCAVIPTLLFVWKYPMKERPFAWYLFSVGFGLAAFAVTDGKMSSYALPIYMSIGSSLVWLPQIIRRFKKSIPLRKWY